MFITINVELAYYRVNFGLRRLILLSTHVPSLRYILYASCGPMWIVFAVLKRLHPTVSNNRARTMRPSNKIPKLNTRPDLTTKITPWPNKESSSEARIFKPQTKRKWSCLNAFSIRVLIFLQISEKHFNVFIHKKTLISEPSPLGSKWTN